MRLYWIVMDTRIHITKTSSRATSIFHQPHCLRWPPDKWQCNIILVSGILLHQRSLQLFGPKVWTISLDPGWARARSHPVPGSRVKECGNRIMIRYVSPASETPWSTPIYNVCYIASTHSPSKHVLVPVLYIVLSLTNPMCGGNVAHVLDRRPMLSNATNPMWPMLSRYFFTKYYYPSFLL